MTLQEQITKFGLSQGIDAIGYCGIDAVRTLREPYQSLLAGYKSVIVILESYLLSEVDSKPSETLVGFFSGAAIFRDYHQIVKEKLQLLSRYLVETYNAASLAFCDTDPFSDRELAVAAGLGTIGKNTMLINEHYGSQVYIGLLLTDLDLGICDTGKTKDPCANCQKCIDACPSKALSSNGMNPAVCISSLTQQKDVPPKFFKVMGRQIYGCDICQRVCPENNQVSNRMHEPLIHQAYSLRTLLQLDNRTFKESIVLTSSGWIGKKRLQRNALIALGNIGTADAADQLINIYQTDARKDICSTALSVLESMECTEAAIFISETINKFRK